MQNRLYKFDWSFVGDVQEGRPNLGNMVNVEVYRLFQYTLRDVLEAKYGTEEADKALYDAGFLAGTHFYQKFISPCETISQFVEKTQNALRAFSIGILRVEEADAENLQFMLTVSEDLDCSGLPELDHGVCTYDEGFIAGLFFAFSGKQFNAKEVDCWCTGDRVCRFQVSLA